MDKQIAAAQDTLRQMMTNRDLLKERLHSAAPEEKAQVEAELEQIEQAIAFTNRQLTKVGRES